MPEVVMSTSHDVRCPHGSDFKWECPVCYYEVRDALARYRRALEEIGAISNQQSGGDWDEIEQARDIARKALDEEEG